MKKYCKCNISPKKVLQYCKSCNKQYFANTLQGTIGRPSDGHSGNYGGLLRGFWVYWLQGCWVNEKRYDIHWAMSMARSNNVTKNLIRRRGLFWALHISTRTSLIIRYYLGMWNQTRPISSFHSLTKVSIIFVPFQTQYYLYHMKYEDFRGHKNFKEVNTETHILHIQSFTFAIDICFWFES